MVNRFIDLIGIVSPFTVVNIIKEVDMMNNGEKITFIVDEPFTIKAVQEELENYEDLLINIKKRKKLWEIIISKKTNCNSKDLNKKNLGKERRQIAKEHAKWVLEQRNKAFRVLYDTVSEVEGAPDENLYSIICRNLRKISNTEFAAIASYDSYSNTLTLRGVDGYDNNLYIYRNDSPEKIKVSSSFVKLLKERKILNCRNNHTFLDSLFPKTIPGKYSYDDYSHWYILSFIRNNELLAVGYVKLETNKKLKMKDMIDNYLNFTSMIFQRVNAIKALQESEERFRSLYENSSIGIYRITPEGKILLANPALVEMLGFPSFKKLVEYNLKERRLDKSMKRPQFREMIEKESKINGLEQLWQLPNNSLIFVRESAVAIRDENGKVLYYDGTVENITKRKIVEDSLLKINEQNKLLLTSISSILIAVDTEGNITHWNSVAEKEFNIKANNVIGKPFFECGISWDWISIRQYIKNCWDGKESIPIQNFKYTHIDGREGFLDITISPFPKSKQGKMGFLLLGDEITEKKILESQLTQAQKLESIGQLAAGIAHEINTPIQYIGDNTRFINDSFEYISSLIEKQDNLLNAAKNGNVTPELIKDVEMARDETDIEFLLDEIPKATSESMDGISRVSHIVKAMREFSHLDIQEKETIDINQAIESTIIIARNEWKYVAEVETDLDPDLPFVSCHKGEFNQVILNLILNAIHAIEDVIMNSSEKKGLIRISTSQDGDWVIVKVNDSGPGIPKEIRNKIFDPFFTTKEVGKGTGQGLAICYDVVVKRHGGTITFETEMGKGTTFIIRIPINPELDKDDIF